MRDFHIIGFPGPPGGPKTVCLLNGISGVSFISSGQLEGCGVPPKGRICEKITPATSRLRSTHHTKLARPLQYPVPADRPVRDG